LKLLKKEKNSKFFEYMLNNNGLSFPCQPEADPRAACPPKAWPLAEKRKSSFLKIFNLC
jgi:hypothetical protein